MTTDAFTTAARVEAEKRWSRDLLDDRPLPGPARMNRRIGFDLGAQWARKHLIAKEADAERAVRKLHTPREEQVVTGDCSIEECDHEDECPTVPFTVCTECWHVVEESDPYFGERGVASVAYPCATVQALTAAKEARHG